MNYRLLFILSFLILGVGIAGLFVMDNDNPVKQQVVAQLPVAKEKDVVITTAIAERDVKKGQLISADDYKISNVTIQVKDGDDTPDKTPQLAFNLRSMIADGGTGSLVGFLAKENIAKGSLIEPAVILSPKAPDFILSSLNPAEDVAYSLPVGASNAYLLDTLKTGAYVSLFASFKQANGDQMQGNLVKVVDYVPVLRVTQSEQKDEKNSSAGVLILKLSVKQLEQLFKLPQDATLLALPADKPQPVQQRGLLIRQLRG